MNNRSIYFTPDHHIFREKTRDFLKREILPFIDQWETDRKIPKEIWKQLGMHGFLGLHYPVELGGSQKDFFYSVVFLEELGKTGYAGFRLAVGLHAYMATTYLAHAGNEALKEKYLTPAISGDKISALAISEVDAGSDLSNIQTTAIMNGENYIINGNKKYVVNGTSADFIIVIVKTNNSEKKLKRGATGISLLVVDANSNGISIKKSDNLGVHCADVAEIQFDNVQVPKANLVGRAEQGFVYLMKCLQLERLASAILAVGGVEHCLDLTWKYLSNRRIYNSTLNKLQVLRHRIARHKTELEVARQFAYHAAWLYEQGQLPIIECSMAKLKCTELSNEVAQDCLQFHGAHGYYNANFISRMYRDTPVATIGAGSSEVMCDIIAQLALDEAAPQ